jgi:D-3-phosphoglycerate dehydrogenase
VKELVLASLLIGSRQLEKASEFMRSLESSDNAKLHHEIETNKKQFVGHEIRGKTLGVIGLGNIGVRVANDALALGMSVLGFDPVMTIENALALSPGVKKVNKLDELLSASDSISIHIPLNDKTKQFINGTRLALMKDNVLLLNFSRAGIVDDEAILNALSTKKLSGYITDFPSVTLKEHPQVICMPHLGASTHEAEENCARILCKNIRDFLEHGTIKDSVNFPNTDMPWLPANNQIRLVITNSNVPGAIAAISQAISQAGLNINQMINHSSETIAYNLIDVTGKSDKNMLHLCDHLPGILHTRIIIGSNDTP